MIQNESIAQESKRRFLEYKREIKVHSAHWSFDLWNLTISRWQRLHFFLSRDPTFQRSWPIPKCDTMMYLSSCVNKYWHKSKVEIYDKTGTNGRIIKAKLHIYSYQNTLFFNMYHIRFLDMPLDRYVMAGQNLKHIDWWRKGFIHAICCMTDEAVIIVWVTIFVISIVGFWPIFP